MRSWIKVGAAGLILAAGLGCYQPMQEATSGPDVDAIKANSAAEFASLVNKDADAHLATMTEDCIVMPPNEPAVVGHEAVAAWNTAFGEMFDVSGGYTGSEVVVMGDWAIERYIGEFTMTPVGGGEAATETFKGIHIYKRQADGSWKIAQDIWNSDTPAM
jgi:ketosteroid isomerase-like protein